MTLKEIAARLEAIEGTVYDDSKYVSKRAVERLRLDIERYVLKTEGKL